jgi:hypothetical protein
MRQINTPDASGPAKGRRVRRSRAHRDIDAFTDDIYRRFVAACRLSSNYGSTIRTRGFQEVNNRFGGNCFTCHVKARAEFDLVCDNNHGCDPIPITRAMSGALQRTDPRCKNPPVSAEDAAALGQLAAIVKALGAASAPKPSP